MSVRDTERANYAARTLDAILLMRDGPVTAPVVAARLGVHRRTARRLLGELHIAGYATRTETRHGFAFGPGERLVELASLTFPRQRLSTNEEDA